MAVAISRDYRTLITALQNVKKNMNYKIVLQPFLLLKKYFRMVIFFNSL